MKRQMIKMTTKTDGQLFEYKKSNENSFDFFLVNYSNI